MARLLIRAVALASALASLAVPAAAQSGTAVASAPKSITTLGCYSHADPLVQQGTWTFQSSGYCQGQCLELNKAVMAITGGSTCYCGDELPSLDSEVSGDKCATPCNGYSPQSCGGIGYWQVYLTGLTGDVSTASNTTSSAGSSGSASPTEGAPSSSTTQPSVVTRPGETVVVTASAAASHSGSGGGPNKVGIAVGVVVGVLALAGIVGGVLLYLRRRRNREIEEEHRNATISSFVGSQKSDKSSLTDQRLDPSVFSHRRQSIGSIADERDFSRRILQVRNPDRDSKASNLA